MNICGDYPGVISIGGQRVHAMTVAMMPALPLHPYWRPSRMIREARIDEARAQQADASRPAPNPPTGMADYRSLKGPGRHPATWEPGNSKSGLVPSGCSCLPVRPTPVGHFRFRGLGVLTVRVAIEIPNPPILEPGP